MSTVTEFGNSLHAVSVYMLLPDSLIVYIIRLKKYDTFQSLKISLWKDFVVCSGPLLQAD